MTRVSRRHTFSKHYKGSGLRKVLASLSSALHPDTEGRAWEIDRENLG